MFVLSHKESSLRDPVIKLSDPFVVASLAFSRPCFVMTMYLEGGAFKSQHPSKGDRANADMTCHGSQFAVVLDGVSGVPPPMKPEDLSADLRDCLRHNLKKRFHPYTDRQQYDADGLISILASSIVKGS
jgi:hypothetical protein